MPSLLAATTGSHGVAVVGRNASLWWAVVGSPATNAVTVRNGPASFLFDTSGGDASCLLKHLPVTASQTTLVLSFGIKFDAMPNGTTELIELFAASGAFVYLQYNQATGYLRINMNGTAKTDRVAVTTGQWYQIDLNIDISANPWTVDWQVDGVAQTQESQAIAASTWATSTTGFWFGTYTARTAKWYLADLGYSHTAGDYPLGELHFKALSPSADGTHSFSPAGDFKYDGTGGTNVDPSATDVYSYIDDTDLTGGTDRITNDAAGATEYCEVELGNVTRADAAIGVSATFAGIAETGGGVSPITIQAVNGGTASAVVTANVDSAGRTYGHGHLAAVPGGGTWTAAVLNALKLRFLSSSVVRDPSLHGVMVEVVYQGPEAGAGGLSAGVLKKLREWSE